MKIFTNKKGDLSLSVNAIVILVIAVIFLGLAIGFTTKMLRTSSESLLPAIENVDISTPADSEHPIRMDGTLSIKSGSQKPFGISFYNKKSTDASDAVPYIQCSSDGTDKFDSTTTKKIKFIALKTTVAPHALQNFKAILDAGTTSGSAMDTKTYLCTLMIAKSTTGVPTADIYESVQISLEVSG